MSESICIDLHHLGFEGAIGSYLVPGDEPALVDPGPSTTIERLVEGLRAQGIGFRDLRHIVLTHIHLDHAGASGHMVALFPEATVYVHEDGAPHLVDPTRLVASTRRTFGDAHDRLWARRERCPPTGSGRGRREIQAHDPTSEPSRLRVTSLITWRTWTSGTVRCIPAIRWGSCSRTEHPRIPPLRLPRWICARGKGPSRRFAR